jgi:hypothetical protein
MKLTPSGQPVQGGRYSVTLPDDSTYNFIVVGKLFGHKGSKDLIGVIIESEAGARQSTGWPLETPDGHPLSLADWRD